MPAFVGENQHFRRPGDHVDADLAEDEALGRRHIGIAWADNLGDRRDGLGAMGERGHRLGATDAIDLVDAGELRRREHERRKLALRRRHGHHQPRNARDLGRHRIHQHRGRIGGGASGHVEADRLDRAPARRELDAQRVDETIVGRELPAVVGLDPITRERERIERPTVARRIGRIDFIGPYSQVGLLEIDPIQFPAELDQGAIAAGGDVRDDRAHDRIDLGRCLALGGEKGTEALGESRRAAVETDRHGPVLPGHSGRIGGQWRGSDRPSTPRVGGIVNMDGTPARGPRWPQIGQLGSQAFDLEPQRPPAREDEVHDSGGRIGLAEFDRQQVEHRVLAGWIDVSALAAFDALEAQRRAAASEFGLCPLRGEPSAESQSKRLSATTKRLSCGRHMTSATLTSASCRWVDTTSRSSRSRATNFTGSMTRSRRRYFRRYEVIRKGLAAAQAGQGPIPARQTAGTRTTRRPAARS